MNKSIARSFIILLLSFYMVSCSSETAEQQIEKAREMYSHNQYRKALIELKRVLSDDEKNIVARRLLGSIYLKIGDGLSSEKELKRYIEYGGNQTDVILDMAQALLLSKKYELLVNSYTQDQFEQPEDKAAISTYRGNAFLELKKYDQADKSYEQALAAKDDYIAARLGQAWLLISKQDWTAAESKLKKLTEDHPEYRDAWTAQAGLYRLQNKIDQAVASYEKAVALDGSEIVGLKSYSIRVGLIQALLAKNDIEGAEIYVSSISAAYPDLPFTIYYQGLVAYLKKDYKLARGKFQDVTQAIPDYMPPYMLLGAIHYVNGNYEQANVSLTRYVRSAPSNIEARKLLAAVHIKLNQNNEALDILAPVLSSGAPDSRILGLLGEMAARDSGGEQAIRTLMQAAKDAPDNAEIGNTLAVAYMRNARYDEALSSLQQLGDAADNRSVILQIRVYLYKRDIANARKLARSLYDQSVEKSSADTINGIVEVFAGQADEARKFFKSAAQASPSNIMARLYLARFALSSDRLDDARLYFTQILSIRDSFIPAYIGLAKLEHRLDETEKALEWLKQAVVVAENDITPTLALAYYYLEKKDIDNAKKVLTVSRDKYPDNKFRDLLMARAYQLSGDTAATKKYYNELVKKYPDSSQVYIEFSVFLSRNNQPEQAGIYLSKAMMLKPGSLRLQSAYARVKLQEGKTDEALEIAGKLQVDNKDSSVGYLLAGDIYMSLTRYDEARVSYMEAQKLNPTRKTLYKLYNSYYALGQNKEGQQLLLSWVTDHPKDFGARYDYANILLVTNDGEGAIKQYQSILKLSPDHIGSLNNIALAYIDIDLSKSLKYAKLAYELDKKHIAIQDTLGWVYYKSGSLDLALPLLEKAASQTRHPSIKFHLASVYADTGQVIKAAEILKLILDGQNEFDEREQAEKLLERIS